MNEGRPQDATPLGETPAPAGRVRLSLLRAAELCVASRQVLFVPVG